MTRHDLHAPRGRGFTLTELMVAVVVLIAVIIATSKIFGTASAVTGKSKAGDDVMVETAAIESQIREDIERITHEGFMMIRCVEVRNDVNFTNGGGLLDPTQPADHVFRCDQLLFFASGIQSSHVFMQGEFANRKPLAGVSRVYYGHAFQLPGAPPAEVIGGGTQVQAIDPKIDLLNDPPVPWDFGVRDTVKTSFYRYGSPNDYQTQTGVGEINVAQPPARQWILARQAVLLADDGDFPDQPTTYLGQVRTAGALGDAVVINGRVDAVTSELDTVRRQVLFDSNGNSRTWLEARDAIGGALFYPRAERVAPSRNRVDQALTSNVLSNACSSFTVEWTYAQGVGRQVDQWGDLLPDGEGIILNRPYETPWFGLGDPQGLHKVRTFYDWLHDPPSQNYPDTLTQDEHPIVAEAIEGANQGSILTPVGNAIEDSFPSGGPSNPVRVYEAVFGFNQDNAYVINNGMLEPDIAAGYTPWPTALRITMTLHDAGGRLDRGREVQFVIDLPKRTD